MPSRPVSFLAVFAILAATFSLSAQQPPATAVLVKAEEGVTLNGQPVAPGTVATPLSGMADLRTAAGRAVVALKRGGTLVLGPNSAARVDENRIYNFNRIEILAGSAVLLSTTSGPVVACGTDARLSSGGIFRFDVLDPERVDGSQRCRLRVYDGAASTPGASLTYVLRGGQQMVMSRRAGDMIPTNPLDVSVLDEFDRWAREQAVGRPPTRLAGRRE